MRRLKQWLQGLLILCLYLLISAYAIIFTNNTGWTLWMLATLFLLSEIISLTASLKRVVLESEQTVLTSVGQPKLVEFSLKKKKRYLLGFSKLKLNSQIPDLSVELLFYDGRKKRVSGEWLPSQRGHVKESQVTAISGDLFDWLQKSRKMKIVTDYFALPEKHKQSSQLARLLERAMRQTTFGEHSFSISNYRPYRPGDAIKQIDWKLSSRQQETILREYQLYQDAEIALLFYGKKSNYFEEMLSLFYGMQEYLHRKKIPVILLGEQVSATAPSYKDYAKIQPLEADVQLPEVSGKTLFVFTPESCDSLNLEIQRLQRRQQVKVYTYENLMTKLEEVRK